MTVYLVLYLPQVKLQKGKLAPQPAMSYEKRTYKDKQKNNGSKTFLHQSCSFPCAVQDELEQKRVSSLAHRRCVRIMQGKDLPPPQAFLFRCFQDKGR